MLAHFTDLLVVDSLFKATLIITVTQHDCHGVSYHWKPDCLRNSLFKLKTYKTSQPHITGPLWRNYWSFCSQTRTWSQPSINYTDYQKFHLNHAKYRISRNKELTVFKRIPTFQIIRVFNYHMDRLLWKYNTAVLERLLGNREIRTHFTLNKIASHFVIHT